MRSHRYKKVKVKVTEKVKVQVKVKVIVMVFGTPFRFPENLVKIGQRGASE